LEGVAACFLALLPPPPAALSSASGFCNTLLMRARTRGIIGVSVVSLFHRGGDFAEAVRHAERYLAATDLPDFAWASFSTS
jgi:hypothetical protein